MLMADHSFIQFDMAHYYAPPEFCQLLQSWYSGLTARVSTVEWFTAAVPLQTGVYQGDPLSVVIFLTVMNTLSDMLHTQNDLGFPLPSLPISINQLLYTDDTCVALQSTGPRRHGKTI